MFREGQVRDTEVMIGPPGGVQTRRRAGQGGRHRRIADQYQRVMAGHHVIGAGGRFREAVLVDVEERPGIVPGGEDTAAFGVGVEVGRVRGEEDRAPAGGDPHHLGPVGVTTDQVDAGTGRDLPVAVVDADPAGVDQAQQHGDVVDLVGRGMTRVGHGRPDGEP